MKFGLTENRIRRIIRESIMSILNETYPGLTDNVGKDELSRYAAECGFKYIAYHNTDNEELTFFDVRSSGIHFGSRVAADERGKVRGDKETWTNEYFLKIDNPYIIERDFDWEGEALDNDMPNDEFERWCEDSSANHYLERNGFTRVIYDDNGEYSHCLEIEEMLKQQGYDCIIYRNEQEDVGNYSVAMFNPNNIKLARVTYDDDGNEIPLEERFDTSTDDVRY